MSILLTLLRWLGGFILILLGIAFGALLLALLVPVRYRADGKRLPQTGEMSAKGKVSWLCSLVSLTFQYQQEFTWKLKILGIPLKLGQEDPSYDEEWEEEQVEEWIREECWDQHPVETPNVDSVSSGADTMEPTWKSTRPDMADSQNFSTKPVDPVISSGPTLQAQDTEEMPGVMQRLGQMWSDLLEKLRHLRKTMASLPEKIRTKKRQADIWLAFAKSQEVKLFVSICWKQLKKLLHHILPTKLKVTGNYGFEDPALTGQITGVLCMLPKRFQKHMHLEPHFQEECLDGHILIRGRIRVGSLLVPLLAILVKPCTWKVYQRYKRITDPSSAKRASKKRGSKKGKKKGSQKGKNVTSKNKKRDPHKGGK